MENKEMVFIARTAQKHTSKLSQQTTQRLILTSFSQLHFNLLLTTPAVTASYYNLRLKLHKTINYLRCTWKRHY